MGCASVRLTKLERARRNETLATRFDHDHSSRKSSQDLLHAPPPSRPCPALPKQGYRETGVYHMWTTGAQWWRAGFCPAPGGAWVAFNLSVLPGEPFLTEGGASSPFRTLGLAPRGISEPDGSPAAGRPLPHPHPYLYGPGGPPGRFPFSGTFLRRITPTGRWTAPCSVESRASRHGPDARCVPRGHLADSPGRPVVPPQRMWR